MNESYMRAPHRRSGAEERSTNAALLIDFDNVTMGIRSNLGVELRKLLDSDMIRGKVAVQRAYADWRRYPQYIVPLSEASIDLIFAPAYGSSKKNATDIRLAIDALELVFTRPEIGTYILLSGDSDFSSLVLKLKEYGKYVIGVGMQESSSDLLVQNCDEYYSYNSISGLTSAAEGGAEKHDPWVLAARAIRRMVDRGDVMRSDRFKQVMLELDGSFDEKEIGYSKFNRFVTEAASRGIVTLEKAPNGQYEVAAGPRAAGVADGSAVPEAKAPTPSASGPSRERRSRGRSRTERSESRERRARDKAPPAPEESPTVDEDRLRAAYRLLQEVTAELAKPDEPVRDSEVKRQMLEKDGKFDEGALGFRKFSRFLRQAHDEEVIDLERGPEGNYLVSPAGDGAGAAGRRAKKDDGGARERSEAAPGGETARSRGRESRRGGRGRGRRDAQPEAREEAASAPVEEEPAPEAAAPPAQETHRESGAKEEAGAPGGPASVPTSGEPSDPASHEEHRRATLGRFRRGSRGRSSASSPASAQRAVVPGPVDADAGGTDRPAAEPVEGSDGEPAAAEREPARNEDGGASGDGRRTLGGRDRGRRRGGSSARREASAEPSSAAGGAAAGGGDAGPFREKIEEMARNYPGVGRRTAEVLFGEFGEDVYDVIDASPDKIREVLPEHRAKAVLEGRETEREKNGD